MNREFFILTVFLLSSFSVFSQDLYVSSVEELTNDISARTSVRLDDKGNPCALVRVCAPTIDEFKFEESCVGNVDYLPGEYRVYISSNALSLSFDYNEEHKDIVFSEYGIVVEEKKCYRITLKKRNKTQNDFNVGSLRIVSNYDNAVVLIDGIPVGQTPLLVDDIKEGTHKLSIPNTDGYTMNDTIIQIKKNTVSNIELTLHREGKTHVFVDFVQPGGDSSGWYYVYGTNVIKKGEKYGIVDYTGEIIVPIEYDFITPDVRNGYYVVADIVANNGKFGLYEPSKGLVVPCIYDSWYVGEEPTHKELMIFGLGNQKVVLDPNGKVLFTLPNCNYYIENDYIRVSIKNENNKEVYGVYNKNGEEVIPPKYKRISKYNEGYWLFEDNSKRFGIIDTLGNIRIIPENYYVPTDLDKYVSCNIFLVQDLSTRKYGYMNTRCELVIPAIYDDPRDAPFRKDVNILSQGGNKYLVSSDGSILASNIDCDIVHFNRIFLEERVNVNTTPDYFEIENKEKDFGVINAKGDVIISPKYDRIFLYFDQEGYFFVCREDRTHDEIFDGKGNLVMSMPDNTFVSEIKDGFIRIYEIDTQSYGYINKNGDILFNCIFGYPMDVDVEDIIEDQYIFELSGYGSEADLGYLVNGVISEGYAVVSMGDRFGFIDNKGKFVVPLEYTVVTPFINGVAYGRQQNGKWVKLEKDKLQ